MTIDQQLAQLQLSIYNKQGGNWDALHYSDIVWGSARIGGVTAIIFRGSVAYNDDWLKDVDILADPAKGMGIVHRGFYLGLQDVWSTIKATTSGPRIVAGHSLGAARATLLAGLMLLDGQPPIARVCWGEPCSGFDNFADLIKAIPARSYRNSQAGNVDPVTEVPVFPYVHASPLINLPIPIKPSDFIETSLERVLPHGWLHNMILYARHTP